MSDRKSPILLRRAPVSGGVMALHRYTRKVFDGGSEEVLCAALDGKQDVTADFDALVCELLLNPAPKIIEQLDGAARGMELTVEERQEIAVVPLCHEHHQLFDESKIDLLPYLEPEWRDSQEWAAGAVGLASALRSITGDRMGAAA